MQETPSSTSLFLLFKLLQFLFANQTKSGHKLVLIQKILIMVATVASSTVFPVASLPSKHKLSKSILSGSLKFRINVRNPTKINSTSLKTRDGDVSSPSSSSSISFLTQMPDWNILFNPISPILEEDKLTETIDSMKTKGGRFVDNGLVFRQNISIRSYEIGADGKVSLEALMNHLQETGLNHMKLSGLLGDGLGSTPEMAKKKLFWVATKVELAMDRYPTWGDEVVVDNWIVAVGKNTMRRDSVIRDCKIGQTLIRASSNWVMMSKETRRLSRIPQEVRDEMSPYLMDAAPIIEDDMAKLPKLDEGTSDSIVSGLKPRWSDLDINKHVNNAKYIGWVLESAPPSILESHEISRVTMEYRRECHREDVLQSLTAVCGGVPCNYTDLGDVECHHLLRLDGGAEVMKAKTQWRPRNSVML